VQPLIEKKSTNDFSDGKEDYLIVLGDTPFVTSVLFSIPTYHLTIFPLAAWAKKQIDKIRHSFLQKGEETANGGHCLVNWQTVCMTKDLGGLGMIDLDKISRSLRLWWTRTIPNMPLTCGCF
jgi:hypothetical protein